MKLNFKKLKEATNIRWLSIINIYSFFDSEDEAYYPYCYVLPGNGLRMSCIKLKIAHSKHKPKMIETKMMSPIYDKGANPSGVEDPTTGIDSFIIINILSKYIVQTI